MNMLSQRGYHTITMAQLVAHFKRQHPLPVNPIVITFDDGWESNTRLRFLYFNDWD